MSAGTISEEEYIQIVKTLSDVEIKGIFDKQVEKILQNENEFQEEGSLNILNLLKKYNGTNIDEIYEEMKNESIESIKSAYGLNNTQVLTFMFDFTIIQKFGQSYILDAEVTIESTGFRIVGKDYVVKPMSEVIDLGGNQYFIAKNDVYMFVIENKESGDEKVIEVKVEQITSNYNIGKQYEIAMLYNKDYKNYYGATVKEKNSNNCVVYDDAILFMPNGKCHRLNKSAVGEEYTFKDGTICQGEKFISNIILDNGGSIGIFVINDCVIATRCTHFL